MLSRIGRLAMVAVMAASSALAQNAVNPTSAAPKLERFDASLLDTTKDPCVDFYAYACSKWQTAHPIPSDLPSVGTWTSLFLWNQTILQEAMQKDAADAKATGTAQQVGAYWTSCMDTRGRTARGRQWLAAQLKPIDAMKSKKQLARVVAHLHQGLTPAWESDDNETETPLFGFGPSQDMADSSKMVAGFDQGGLSLPSRDYYLNTDARSQKIREAYKKHLVRMFQLAAGDSADKAAEEAASVFAIEKSLAGAQMTAVDRRDPAKIYNKRSLTQIKSSLSALNVEEYLRLMQAPQPPFYIVSAPEFLPALNHEIQQRSLAEWKSYLRWWVIEASANKTTPEIEQANFDFFGTVLSGTPQLLPQWRRCVSSADARLGEALGQEYVKLAFPPASKAKAVELMTGIRTALKQDIHDVDWMTDPTKKQAVEKLDAMIQKIGYPDKWRDYSSLTVTKDDYLANVVAANAFEVRRQLKKINQPVDKMEWSMTPSTINAYNDPQNNTINFPAGILQLPLFDLHQSEAANYGSIGVVIGHEITHGFDDQGRKFDAKGNLREWWTEADAKAYDQRGRCIAEQNTHDVPALGVKTDGRLTQGEDTADNGGLHLAMMALENLYKSLGKSLDVPEEDGLTARQRFYSSYAFTWCQSARPERERMQITTNPHSLDQFRVNYPLSNQAGFAKAFGCKAGQPMVKVPACRVW